MIYPASNEETYVTAAKKSITATTATFRPKNVRKYSQKKKDRQAIKCTQREYYVFAKKNFDFSVCRVQ